MIKKGFSLIELMVVLSLIGVVFGIGLARYQKMNRRQIFRQSLETVVEELRLAQDKALSGERPTSCSFDQDLLGYGLLILDNESEYRLISFCSNPSTEQGLAEVVKLKSLEGQVVKDGGADLAFYKGVGQGVGFGDTEAILADLASLNLFETMNFDNSELESIIQNSVGYDNDVTLNFSGYSQQGFIAVGVSGDIYLADQACVLKDVSCEPDGDPCCSPYDCSGGVAGICD